MHALSFFDRVRICETTGMQDGYLRIDVVNSENNFPIEGAEVSVSYGDSGQTQEVLRTNLSGQTEGDCGSSASVSLSLEEQNREKPYADYTVEVRAAGYEPVKVKERRCWRADGSPADPMIPLPDQTGAEENIQIPDHTLYGSYPPKIAEDEVKPVQESGEIVLSRVVVPRETIVVHDGVPTNASAKDYYVAYRDYIKNVASSEILRDLAAQHDRRQCACGSCHLH